MKSFRLHLPDDKNARKLRPSFWTILFALPAFISFWVLLHTLPNGEWGETQWVCALVLLASFVGVFAAMARTARRITKSAVLYEDVVGSEFILYLRSFADDQSFRLPFQVSFWVRAGQRKIELEELFVHLLQVHGSVVAVGRPHEMLPPLGAARLYIEHKDWKGEVVGLMQKSKFIVMLLGNSAGFHWEFSQIVDTACLRKTIVIVPPLPPEQANQRWESLVDAVSALPVSLPTRLPPRTVAVAFSNLAQSKFVTTEGYNLQSGKDYIAVTEAALEYLAAIVGCRGAEGFNDDLQNLTVFPPDKKHGFTPPSESFEPPKGWSGS